MVNFNYEVADPRDNPPAVLQYYNIAGIINSKPVVLTFNTGKLMQRVSFITPSLNQCILEIWNSSLEMQPKFSENWKILQFIFCKDVVYHGIAMMDEREVHVYRLSQSRTGGRYIWLSKDDPKFWENPISLPDINYDREKAEVSFCKMYLNQKFSHLLRQWRGQNIRRLLRVFWVCLRGQGLGDAGRLQRKICTANIHFIPFILTTSKNLLFGTQNPFTKL